MKICAIRIASAVVLVSCIGVAVQAQDPAAPQAGPAVPSAPHERMAFLEGIWELEPGGIPAAIAKQAGRLETCTWLPGGRRHLICRTFRKGSTGAAMESMSILSYREEDSTYVQYFAFPGGANLLYHGRPDGDRWIMELQPSPLLLSNKRFRMIITPAGETIHFVEEGSKDGRAWKVTEEFRYRRVKQPHRP